MQDNHQLARLAALHFDALGRASQDVLSLLQLVYPSLDISRGLDFERVLALTHHWVSSNRKPGAQRWEAGSLPETTGLDEVDVNEYMGYLGFYEESTYRLTLTAPSTFDLVRSDALPAAHVNVAFVPGGRIANGHWPQVLRLAKLFELHRQGTRWDNLVFQVGPRKLGPDELNWEWARQAQSESRTVFGLQFREGWEIEDLPEGSTEIRAMSQLWNSVVKPDYLYARPFYAPKLDGWVTAENLTGALRLLMVSIQPHQFQGLINLRNMAIGSSMDVVYVSADKALHNVNYMLDGLRRFWGAVAKVCGYKDEPRTA